MWNIIFIDFIILACSFDQGNFLMCCWIQLDGILLKILNLCCVVAYHMVPENGPCVGF